jgi:hypothetical protein
LEDTSINAAMDMKSKLEAKRAEGEQQRREESKRRIAEIKHAQATT